MALGSEFLVRLIDPALVVVTILMVLTQQTVLFFHIIFVLLALGAFFWQFRSFVLRSLLWVTVATTAVLQAVYRGATQPDELIEIPLLTLILLIVFVIARYRARAQGQSQALNEQLARRLAELDAANRALRQEGDARARLQEEMLRSHEHYIQMLLHDLKGPLATIRGYLDMLVIIGVTDLQREAVDSAKLSSTRMLDLVTDVLDVARFEEGRMQLRREPTNIGTLLQESVDEMQLLIDQDTKRVTLNIPTPAPMLAVDAGLLRRIVANLLSNAIRHTAPGTEVRLSVASNGPDSLQLQVEDNGAGIPLERQQFLFERFSTMAQTSARRHSSGLGLAFCKLAVEAHGGTIGVRSAPGAGTAFIITLPAPPQEAQVYAGH
jgi:signal transduction histidine kinase